MHLADAAQVAALGARDARGAQRLADAFWPGPLTLILPRAARVSDAVTGGQDSVGLRVPSHPVARALLRAFAAAGGRGIAAPSANRFGRISPTTAQHVADDLGDDVALILDGGACDVGIESTIVAFGDGEPMLLRPGGIAATELARVLGREPRAPDARCAARVGHARVALRAAHAARGSSTRRRWPRGADAPTFAVLARTVARPAQFAGRMDRRAARRRALRARPLRQPARARARSARRRS